ncbi:glycosyltransferase family 4 protein [Kiritimatiellota bacterium B12222]|nr:glycosyltransferase family 4 protein [Kiritimatiellota bacterium B12222]
MNILILNTCLGEGFGAEGVLRHLLEGWDSKWGTLHVASPPESGIAKSTKKKGVLDHPLYLKSNRIDHQIRGVLDLKKRLKNVSIDIVHAWTAREFDLTLLFPTSTIRTGTLHDHPCAEFHSWARRKLIRLSSNQFSALSCVSTAVVDACKANGYKAPLKTLHNGLVDLKRPQKEPSPPLPLRIGFLGMYADWKGFDLILPWIHELSAEPVEWKLFGTLSERNKCLSTQLPKNATLMGWTSAENIWGNIDLLVHASTQFDPLPTVLIEAARAGIPSIASTLGGSQEIIDHNITGFLFDTHNPEDGLKSLKYLLNDPSKAKQMSLAARNQFTTYFQVNKMTDSYRTFWKSLL